MTIKARALLILLALGVVAIGICSNMQLKPGNEAQQPKLEYASRWKSVAVTPEIRASIDRAIHYFKDETRYATHSAYFLLHFLHRRFAIEQFGDMPARYQAYLATLDKNDPNLNIFERLMYPDRSVDMDRIRSIRNRIDMFTTRALYCDQITLEDNYQAGLRETAQFGAYSLTHMGLASQWLRENGCDEMISQQVVDEIGTQQRWHWGY